MKIKLFILNILIFFNLINGQVKLSLDCEIKEPDKIIFNKIVDIEIDSQNNIYLLDRKEKFLYLFSEEGQFLRKIGHPGKGPGEFERPQTIFIDKKDNIYILDSINRRVEVYNNNYNFVKSIKMNRFPLGGKNSLVVDENKNIYVSGFYYSHNVVLCKYSSQGEFLKVVPLPIMEYNGINLTKTEKFAVNQYIGGGSLCLGKENRIYFSYKWPYKICMIEKDENKFKDISGTGNLNWKPLIFLIKPKGIYFGRFTISQKIFWLNKEYIINSIRCVDWEGNPNVKIPTKDVLNKTGFDKYYRVKRVFNVLDVFTKDGQFIASGEINDNIIFLNSDNNNRIIGVKDDGENIPTIVRYKVEIIKTNVNH